MIYESDLFHLSESLSLAFHKWVLLTCPQSQTSSLTFFLESGEKYLRSAEMCNRTFSGKKKMALRKHPLGSEQCQHQIFECIHFPLSVL